jgi:transcriptional regulator with XRE-family HTH domain
MLQHDKGPIEIREGSMAAEARDPRQPDDIDVEVGRRVRVERIARGLTQTDLAKHVGVTFQQVQKYESGANRISTGRLTKIGQLFGVSVTYLLGASNRKPTAQPDPKEQAELSEAMQMLGRSGALRLLKAFAAIPSKPAKLRDGIVAMLEGLAAARPVAEKASRSRRSSRRAKSRHPGTG